MVTSQEKQRTTTNLPQSLNPDSLLRSLITRLGRKGCWVTWTISCHSSWAKMAATVQSLIHFWKNFDLPQLQVGRFSSFLLFDHEYEYLEPLLIDFHVRNPQRTASLS